MIDKVSFDGIDRQTFEQIAMIMGDSNSYDDGRGDEEREEDRCHLSCFVDAHTVLCVGCNWSYIGKDRVIVDLCCKPNPAERDSFIYIAATLRMTYLGNHAPKVGEIVERIRYVGIMSRIAKNVELYTRLAEED